MEFYLNQFQLFLPEKISSRAWPAGSILDTMKLSSSRTLAVFLGIRDIDIIANLSAKYVSAFQNSADHIPKNTLA